MLGPIPAGLAFPIAWRAANRRTRIAAWVVGAALLGATAWMVASTPGCYKSQARFDLVFFKIQGSI